MKAWWEGLEPRERITLMLGGGALILVLWLSSYLDMRAESRKIQQRLPEQRSDVTWMQEAAQEVRRLGAGSRNRATQSQGSVLATVDRTAKSAGLGQQIGRIQPDGELGVKVWIEGAGFDRLLPWIESLEQRQGIRVEAMTVKQTQTAGQVEARISFRRSES